MQAVEQPEGSSPQKLAELGTADLLTSQPVDIQDGESYELPTAEMPEASAGTGTGYTTGAAALQKLESFATAIEPGDGDGSSSNIGNMADLEGAP